MHAESWDRESFQADQIQRKGITLLQFAQKPPGEAGARKWFEGLAWPDGECRCPRCEGTNTYAGTHKTMPYRCRDCKQFFSERAGMTFAASNL